MIISPGQLAYLSIALRAGMSAASLLHPHFVKNFRVYGRALTKAKALGLSIPRRAGKEMQELAETLRSSLGLEGWKQVNYQFLACLLIFDAQLDRNQKRCENGERWIHVEVHCRALHYATKECGAAHDSVILSFLEPGEISLIAESFEEVSSGHEFGLVVQAKQVAPHGLRETTRCLLEIDEVASKDMKPATRREVDLACQVEARSWNQQEDPEAARIRVRGIVHEEILRQEMQVCLKEASLSSEDEIAAFLMQEDAGKPIVVTSFMLPANSEAPANEAPKPSFAARSKAQFQSAARVVEPLVAQLWISAAFLISLVGCLVATPQEVYSAGIAWWYFELGALVVGAVILLSPIVLRDLDSPLRVDLFNLLGMAGIFSIMLLLIEKDTPHFGIAWWHASLGGLVGGVASMVAGPYFRSLMTKEDLRFGFN